MAEEKVPNFQLQVQEGYDHRAVSQVFSETLQKGYNGQPLVHTFTERMAPQESGSEHLGYNGQPLVRTFTQIAQDNTPATPQASRTSSSPSAPPSACSERNG